MKKIRHKLNKHKKVSISISVILIIFSGLLVYIDYNNAQKVLDSIKVIDFEAELLKRQEQFLNKIKSLDLETDNSITKFVNNEISFNSIDYIPEGLESIKSEYIFDTKWYWKVRKVANDSLQKLAKEFYMEFNIKLKVVSSYRSYNYQKGIKDRWCPDNLCAKAWYSEHQSWLAVDIFAASTQQDWQTNPNYTKYFEWFKENAHKYWFHNTYQRWLEIDWYEIEPWHWRYMWKDLAKYLFENELTIAEYYNKI